MTDSIKRMAQQVAERHMTAKQKIKAEYWFELRDAKNITVKEYEAADRGNTYVNGTFVLVGYLHIQPQGTSWSTEFPVKHLMNVTEDPQSGTYIYSPKDRDDPIARLVILALDPTLEYKIINALGTLDFVPYG